MKKYQSLMLLACVFFLILSCKKDYVTKFDDLKEDIKLAEIHNWELQLKQQIQAPSEFLIHKAQRFFDKGKLVVRVPIKNSNGYFFFMKEEHYCPVKLS